MAGDDLPGLIRALGQLVGDVIDRQEGEQAFATVENLRRGFVRLRADRRRDAAAVAALARGLAGVTPPLAGTVGRAFSVYFSLVNIAEEVTRARDRRRGAFPRGFAEVFGELRTAGVDAATFRAGMARLTLTPVLTAHPTEVRRQAIQQSHRRIWLLVERLLAAEGAERARVMAALRDEIAILWKTNPVRAWRLSVADEVANGLAFFRMSLFDALPATLAQLEAAAVAVWGPDARGVASGRLIQFGSWIGGDRDGNPNVTAAVTLHAGREQARAVLREYLARLDRLVERLSQSANFIRPDPRFQASLAADEAALAATLFADRPTYFDNEPYRRKLSFMRHRLHRRLAWIDERAAGRQTPRPAEAYATPADLIDDLMAIASGLAADGDGALADGELTDLARLVESCGFHLARLDLRQEAGAHARAVAELLRGLAAPVDYASLDEARRLDLLLDLVARPGPALLMGATPSPETGEILASLAAVATLQEEFGTTGIESYVVSMADRPSAVVEVLFLARLAGLVALDPDDPARDRVHVRIAPLFETAADLTAAPTIMATLLEQPLYRRLLAAAGGWQEVMLGYSDSCKDAGILGSAWALQRAQSRLTEVFHAADQPFLLFHGRGGSHARGGGPTHDAILAGPPGSVEGPIKFTEQGEVLSFKYSHRETAQYELTVALTGLVRATLGAASRPDDGPDFAQVLGALATAGEEAYRDFVGRQTLLDYFYQTTPVGEMAGLNIGSRPSHRPAGGRSLKAIRAIPWVFGWAQARLTLPAWFGVGAALDAFASAAPGNRDRLVLLRRRSPTFRLILDNIEMALAKADLPAAALYRPLAADKASAEALWAEITTEFERTRQWLTDLGQSDRLLADNPGLAMSLDRRAPYIDACNALQSLLLIRQRTRSDGEDWSQPLLLSINAVAAGMRNTG
jgi:phosphoenolpyruvate carboxylase